MFIKRSDDILFEAGTQQFFYLHAVVDGSLAPRIPKVFGAFSSAEGDFMVMGEIDAPTLECDISEEEAVKHAASAVK